MLDAPEIPKSVYEPIVPLDSVDVFLNAKDIYRPASIVSGTHEPTVKDLYKLNNWELETLYSMQDVLHRTALDHIQREENPVQFGLIDTGTLSIIETLNARDIHLQRRGISTGPEKEKLESDRNRAVRAQEDQRGAIIEIVEAVQHKLKSQGKANSKESVMSCLHEVVDDVLWAKQRGSESFTQAIQTVVSIHSLWGEQLYQLYLDSAFYRRNGQGVVNTPTFDQFTRINGQGLAELRFRINHGQSENQNDEKTYGPSESRSNLGS